jgi:D-proline reductase (dithiol) PrdB
VNQHVRGHGGNLLELGKRIRRDPTFRNRPFRLLSMGLSFAHWRIQENPMNEPSRPVNYVQALAEHYGSMGYPPYQWTVNDSAPLTPLTKPLSECRIALLTSGGISRSCDLAWDPDARNDFRLDEIPSDSDPEGFQIHDSYYDHSDADEDINTVFPIARLHELAEGGLIGEVARRHWSGFMGRIYKRSQVLDVEAPRFAALLAEDGVDALVAIPA